ncbi:MAG: DUF3617 family protein [Betaproteobacteria bacterium]|nr:DUF3617 family protein [Betaproteobacteria bacterium]
MNSKLAALPFLFITGAALAGSSPMQPGLWEVTMKTDIAGMPMAMPAQTIRHCYTQKDLQDEKKTVPQSQDRNCQITNFDARGNTVTWTIQCKGENAMTGTGTMTVNATSYSGSVRSRMKDGKQTMEMTQSWSGKRVGECK